LERGRTMAGRTNRTVGGARPSPSPRALFCCVSNLGWVHKGAAPNVPSFTFFCPGLNRSLGRIAKSIHLMAERLAGWRLTINANHFNRGPDPGTQPCFETELLGFKADTLRLVPARPCWSIDDNRDKKTKKNPRKGMPFGGCPLRSMPRR